MPAIDVDAAAGTATLALSARVYRLSSVPLASPSFARTATVRVTSRGGRLRIVLTALRPTGEEALRTLAGEFLNELLSVERRRDTIRQNRGQIRLIAARALQSALQTPEQVRKGARVTEQLRERADRLIAELSASPVPAEAASR